jgi:large subunit ribosomal protein L24
LALSLERLGISRVLRDENKVVIEGVNLLKKNRKPRQGAEGRIIDFPAPIHVSNVAIIDPKDNKRTRIGKKLVGEKMVRVARRSSSELE